MSIVELLQRVGTENVQVQSLLESFVEGNITKRGATIKFATEPAYVGQYNRAAALGGSPVKVGLVLWIDAEKIEAAKSASAQPPTAMDNAQAKRV